MTGEIKKHRKHKLAAMAGVEGLEPSRTVLETGMLPLHHTPILTLCIKNILPKQIYTDLSWEGRSSQGIWSFRHYSGSGMDLTSSDVVDRQGLEPRTDRL